MALIKKDGKGSWTLDGVPWEHFRAGATIGKKDAELLYGALCKLMDYEASGLSPDRVEELQDACEELQEKVSELNSGCKMLREELTSERARNRWIPIAKALPKTGEQVLLSFANFDRLAIGRYEEDGSGDGAFYEWDSDEPLLRFDLYVNAWRPLSPHYRDE